MASLAEGIVAPVGVRAVARRAPAGDPLAAFAAVLDDPAAEPVVLIEMQAARIEVSARRTMAVATWPLAKPGQSRDQTPAESVLRFADWGFTTTPDDAELPNEQWESRALDAIEYEERLPLDFTSSRRVGRAFGELRLADDDGLLTQTAKVSAIAGRRVTARLAKRGGGYGESAVLATLLAAGWSFDAAEARIALSDLGAALEKPLTRPRYAGTGDLEGGEDLANKPKPLALGAPKECRLAAVIPAEGLYQSHAGDRMLDHEAVFDWARGLSKVATYPSLTALRAASATGDAADDIPPGTFAEYLGGADVEGGFVRLGSPPNGDVTADLKGDAGDGDLTGYVDRLDGLLVRALTQWGGVRPEAVETSSLAFLSGFGEAGVYLDTEADWTAERLADRVVGSAAASWGYGLDGRLRVLPRLVPPERRTPAGFLEDLGLVSYGRSERLAPVARVQVGGLPIWVEQRFVVDTEATAARRAFLAEDNRRVEAAASGAKVRDLNAREPAPLATLLNDLARCQVLADELAETHGVERQVLPVTCGLDALRARLGSCWRLGEALGPWAAETNVLVVGRRPRLGSRLVDLWLWR